MGGTSDYVEEDVPDEEDDEEREEEDCAADDERGDLKQSTNQSINQLNFNILELFIHKRSRHLPPLPRVKSPPPLLKKMICWTEQWGIV